MTKRSARSRYSKKYDAYYRGTKVRKASPSRSYVRYHVLIYNPKTGTLGDHSTLDRKEALRERNDIRRRNPDLRVGLMIMSEKEAESLPNEEYQRRKWRAVGMLPPSERKESRRKPWYQFW